MSLRVPDTERASHCHIHFRKKNVLANSFYSNSRKSIYINFTGRRPVRLSFIDDVLKQVGDVSWVKECKRAVTAAELYASPYWESQTPRQRQLIGASIAYLIRNGQLPLVKLNPKGQTPNRYIHRK